ncbi:MAG: peptide chain release factor 3 [Firmicutes bacterium]|nr:peptide chain release factor 3 [Bacillota bacterium]
MPTLEQEINRRRTFAIISHPDAGKTTLTEKLLLYGGAIQQAGFVKGKKNSKHAVSDWMEIEKQRGISVTSSVLQFEYNGYCINILDTPGHQDFSEDTYRTLMAADSAVMVIDGSRGIEPQTRKLFKVCAMRHIPIFTFINKMDREAKNPFDLMEELETEFGIGTYPVNWPIGSGDRFKGVYDRDAKHILAFDNSGRGRSIAEKIEVGVDDTDGLYNVIGEELANQLIEDIELLDGASYEFDIDQVHNGQLSPVFFGSALTNFGVEPFLQNFLNMTPTPLARKAGEDTIDPMDSEFSAFVFKIQANMNKAHRDRLAFMRICSGKFDKEMNVYHVQRNKTMKLSQPQQMMAQERGVIDEAYAGDIIGVFDPGIFSIGDTVCSPKMKVKFDNIPTFAPEHFALVIQKDTLKRKQFVKGVTQIAQEGAIQIYTEPASGVEKVYVGVVGVLQFEVLEHRLKSEYNVEIIRNTLPYEEVRWIQNENIDPKSLKLSIDSKLVQDFKGNYLILFNSIWTVRNVQERNPGLILSEVNINN